MTKKIPLTEKILDWFENNSTARVRSAAMAKTMKEDLARTADALSSLSDNGKLIRTKTDVAPAERTKGGPLTQWEYRLPLMTEPNRVKPYTPPTAPARRGSTVALPSLAHTPLSSSVTQAGSGDVTPAAADRSTSLASSFSGEAAAVNEPPQPNSPVAEVGSDDIAESSLESLIIANHKFFRQVANMLGDELAPMTHLECAKRINDRFEMLEKESLKLRSAYEPLTNCGFMLRTPKQPHRVFISLTSAQSAALSAARQHGQGEVFALIPVGKARRGAEWVEAK